MGYTHPGQQGQLLSLEKTGRKGMFSLKKLSISALLLVILASNSIAGVRDHTRIHQMSDTTVTESQAAELTLTLVRTAPQALQTWVRTAGIINGKGNNIVARVCQPVARLLHVGQRIRAFPPDSKSSIYQARISKIIQKEKCAIVEAKLAVTPYEISSRYVLEIVVQRGVFLSVPNEAIIEEGDKKIVYIQKSPSHYIPREIQTGLNGELYTQIENGLNNGDKVVTFGSFFIDADYKLKSKKDTMSHAHMHH